MRPERDSESPYLSLISHPLRVWPWRSLKSFWFLRRSSLYLINSSFSDNEYERVHKSEHAQEVIYYDVR